MDDAGLVRMLDGPGNGFDQPGRLPRRLRLAAQLPVEAAAFDELEYTVGLAIRLAGLEKLDQVGVFQPCRGRHLTAEAAPVPPAPRVRWSAAS